MFNKVLTNHFSLLSNFYKAVTVTVLEFPRRSKRTNQRVLPRTGWSPLHSIGVAVRMILEVNVYINFNEHTVKFFK